MRLDDDGPSLAVRGGVTCFSTSDLRTGAPARAATIGRLLNRIRSGATAHERHRSSELHALLRPLPKVCHASR
ncbi:hypothetical protein, partial [Streptomyces albidus (ex Kaewkla and Franco 2022)]|uniref:hypothetical protein n=1 Tax=Streptomyces albidus (ex Kaewkla and Franco 2022) TaxID=722709 RepID=UPI001B356B34